MEEYLKRFKNKRKKYNNKYNISGKNIISIILLAIIFLLVSLIFIQKSDKNLLYYKEHVFEKNFPFTKVKKLYEKVLGTPLPEENKSTTVFKGELIYKDKKPFYDGTLFQVQNKSLVNNITSGIIVFIGNKDNYGNTVIVQGVDGYDIWYGNIENVSVKLYDYVDSDTVIGNTINDKLYLVIKKDNQFINYDEYQG